MIIRTFDPSAFTYLPKSKQTYSSPFQVKFVSSCSQIVQSLKLRKMLGATFLLWQTNFFIMRHAQGGNVNLTACFQ